jgi:transcriptional activator SPT7
MDDIFSYKNALATFVLPSELSTSCLKPHHINPIWQKFMSYLEFSHLYYALCKESSWNLFINSSHHSQSPSVTPLLLSSFRCRFLILDRFFFPSFSHIPMVDVDELTIVLNTHIDDFYYTLEEELVDHCYFHWMSLQGEADLLNSNEIKDESAVSPQSIDIPGLGHLKYLYRVIENKKGNFSVSKMFSFLSEIRPKAIQKSKWQPMDDGRVGQVELYEAMDKVLKDLRDYKEHSFPFLVRVNKRDAWDYYNIIKDPMDLQTMGKKMKNFQYNSKNDFQHDLDLIWDNCLFYNSDPKSVYRVHANSMRDRTTELMKKVPDIIIRNREDTDYASDSDKDIDESVEDVTISNSQAEDALTVGHYSSNTVPQVTVLSEVNSFKLHLLERNDSILFHHICSCPVSSDEGNAPFVISLDKVRYPFPIQTTDPLLSHFTQCTWEARGELLHYRATQNELPFPERDAITRTSVGMGIQDKLRIMSQTRSTLMRIAENFDHVYLPEILNMFDCFPELLNCDPSVYDVEFINSERREVIPSFIFPTEKSVAPFKQNIELMRECGRLERVITNVYEESPKPQKKTSHNFGFEDEFFSLDSEIKFSFPMYFDNCSESSTEIVHNLCDFSMKKIISTILLNSGFKSVDSKALSILLDIFDSYMSKITSIFNVYSCECDNDKVDIYEIIDKSLGAMGVKSVRILEHYQKSIKIQNSKLSKLKKRLMTVYDKVTTVPSVESTSDNDLVTNLDFAGGDFLKSIDEDYLGLKELGIGIEHVPHKLWNPSTNKQHFNGSSNTSINQKESSQKMFFFPRFPPVSDTQEIIGLAKSFFDEKLAKAADHILIDDGYVFEKKTRKKHKKL